METIYEVLFSMKCEAESNIVLFTALNMPDSVELNEKRRTALREAMLALPIETCTRRI